MLTTVRTQTTEGISGNACLVGVVPEGRLKLLQMEDDPDVVTIVETLLCRLKFDVTSTDRGVEGLRLAASLRPDIITLDIDLPDMTGLEVCRRLKADPETALLPVVFFSGQSNLVEEGLALGAAAFLVKPDDLTRLGKCLREIVETQRMKQHAM